MSTDESREIMSVAEFRKRTGKESERFSDDQVADLIRELTLYADIFIKQLREAPVPKPP